MNGVTVRRAEARDVLRLFELLTEICEFHVNGRPDIFKKGQKYNEQELIQILKDQERPVFVADDGEKVVGYAFCILKRKKDQAVFNDLLTVYIDDLCVDGECRGQGIGRILFEAVKTYAKEVGAYNIDLNVWEFPGSAVGFYENLGMKPERRYMEYIL